MIIFYVNKIKSYILKKSKFILRILRNWRIKISFKFSQLIIMYYKRFL